MTMRWWIIVGVVVILLIAVRSATAGGREAAERQAIRAVFGRNAPMAECVVNRETGATWDPHTVSRTNDHGLFQLHRSTWDPAVNPAARAVVGNITWSRIYEAHYNIMVAYRIFTHSGWSPWGGYC